MKFVLHFKNKNSMTQFRILTKNKNSREQNKLEIIELFCNNLYVYLRSDAEGISEYVDVDFESYNTNYKQILLDEFVSGNNYGYMYMNLLHVSSRICK